MKMIVRSLAYICDKCQKEKIERKNFKLPKGWIVEEENIYDKHFCRKCSKKIATEIK